MWRGKVVILRSVAGHDLSTPKSHTSLLPELVTIPAGEFLMGCELGRDDEKPIHRVWVDEFSLGVFAVTNAEYLHFVEDTRNEMPFAYSEPRFSHPRQPVVAVNWFEAVAYCDWLSLKTGLLFRLPSEAEWERAARAGEDGKLYSWGDEDPNAFDIYRAGWRDEKPQVVGLLRPNGFGIYNLGDNVHEWCRDWYHPEYYRGSPSRNPVNSEPGKRRASRGGSWRHQIKVSRCAARSSLDPSFKYTDYGFRVAQGS
jgi:formylglycine-generating enzyme required for sulfatase activity